MKLKTLLTEIESEQDQISILKKECPFAIEIYKKFNYLFFRGSKNVSVFEKIKPLVNRLSRDSSNVANLLFDNNKDNSSYQKRSSSIIFSGIKRVAEIYGNVHVFFPKGNAKITFSKSDFIYTKLINVPMILDTFGNETFNFLFDIIAPEQTKATSFEQLVKYFKIIDTMDKKHLSEMTFSNTKFQEFVYKPFIKNNVKNSYDYFSSFVSNKNLNFVGNILMSELNNIKHPELWTQEEGYMIDFKHFYDNLRNKL